MKVLPLHVHYESVLQKVGYGMWQRRTMALLMLSSFIGGLTVLNTAFTAAVPREFSCHPKECSPPASDGQAYNGSGVRSSSSRVVTFQMRDFPSLFNGPKERSSTCSERNQLEPEDVVYHSLDCEKMCVPICAGKPLKGQLCNTSSIYHFHGMAMNSSLITENKALCRKPLGFPQYFKTILDFSYMLGVFVGGKVFGYIGSEYGRKRALGLALFTTFIGSGLGGLYRSLWFHPLTRFLSGAGSINCYLLAWMLVLEILSKDTRSGCGRVTIFALMTNLLSVPFALGEAASGLLAWLLPNWVDFQLSVTIICGSGILILIFISESPVWLILHGKHETYVATMTEAAEINGRAPVDLKPDLAEAHEDHAIAHAKLSLWSPPLRTPTFCLAYCWVAMAVIYYGTNFAIEELHLIPGNIHWSVAIVALAEIPAYVAIALMIDSVGRKPVLLFSMAVAACSCVATITQSDSAIPFKLCCLLTKCTVAGTFTLLRVYTAEFYPTALRCKAVSLCKSVAAFASIFSPLLTLLPLQQKELGMFCLQLLNFLLTISTAVVILFLPDTIGLSMPKNIEEVKFLMKNSKPLRELDCNGWEGKAVE